MFKRNPHLAKLKSGYLFPEIHRRKLAFLHKNPEAKLISLGIGDTTEPIPYKIVKGLKNAAEKLGTREGYTGYGPDQGHEILQKAIAEKIYNGLVKPEEIFISDGAKSDIGRLQILLGSDLSIGVQDPAYPVYVDTSLITAKAELHFLPCKPEKGFFPDLEQAPKVDVLFFCSPNNPTGAVSTKEELLRLVQWVKKIGALLVFDAAYSHYIRDPHLPRSIFEIEGAHECAIELNSFSKMAGFTGVRLAWSVVPNGLLYSDGTPVRKDWHRIMTTFFNGASNIAQGGAEAALAEPGLKEIEEQTNFYLENAKILAETFTKKGLTVYGGNNAPYLWVKIPGKTSWEAFEELLEKAHVVATPGSGFGPAGEGFLRFSSFGHRENILEAAHRLARNL